MQFATQSQAETLGYLSDFPRLAYIDADSANLSLDPSSTTSDHVWDRNLIADLEYAALPGAQASGSMVLPTTSLRPTAAPYSYLSYDTGPSHSSGFDNHVTAHFPTISCASTPGEDLLWGNCDSSLSADAPVDFDGWGGLTGIPLSVLTAAGSVVDTVQALDPAELWQGSCNSTQAFASCETAYCAYLSSSLSSQSPSIASPASDWASIFSPAASLSSPETALAASSSSFPSPEPALVAPSPSASKTRQRRKATAQVGRVRSSVSQPTKPSPGTPSFASGRIRNTAPRNKQIPVDEIKGFMRRGGTWFCSNCSYQTRRSKGDMQRHVKTHYHNAEYICCGVPIEDVPGYVGEISYHEGREMVGGCLKAFQRKDSLLRHLKTSDGACIRPMYLGSS